MFGWIWSLVSQKEKTEDRPRVITLYADSWGHFLHLIKEDGTPVKVTGTPYLQTYSDTMKWGPFGYGGVYQAICTSGKVILYQAIYAQGILDTYSEAQDERRMSLTALKAIDRCLLEVTEHFPNLDVKMHEASGPEISDERRQQYREQVVPREY